MSSKSQSMVAGLISKATVGNTTSLSSCTFEGKSSISFGSAKITRLLGFTARLSSVALKELSGSSDDIKGADSKALSKELGYGCCWIDRQVHLIETSPFDTYPYKLQNSRQKENLNWKRHKVRNF
ncbi:hypothetical protein O6H91_04G076200 [Diphasiastrum complanatum]|uniref:Uncharacterized protein n=1 Tax=Diphasiastrum complanatum TaxID=34168 RepID=A0ACC2DZ24_DIPCM|nr:hypothetical protein O6H91_04G076200 [Diphasiastrum complanatum]